MEYATLLLFGFLVGMQHALEADHVAAVAAISTRASGRKAMILRGSFWGLGHTLALFLICGVLLTLGGAITPRMEAMLELLVGMMIVMLGVNVIRSLWRQRPHIHLHEHGADVRHVHVHVHRDSAAHDHGHSDLGLGRAVLVGIAHGAAGSAALLVLAATAADTAAVAAGYVLAFGVGSILGMAALTFVASYPLARLAHCAAWVHTAVLGTVGGFAMLIGSRLIVNSWGGI